MTREPSSPNRRHFLRRLGGTVAALGLASAAGCAAPRAISSEGGGSNQFDGSGLDAAAFRDYRDEMRARYGDHGIFGARSPPDDSSFVTAWTEEFTTGRESWTDDGDGLVRADFAVARYHLGERPDGDRIDAWLLWAGARPLTETARLPELPGGYEPKTSVRVRALGVNLGFAGSLNLVHNTPDGDVKPSQAGRYTVLSGGQSVVVSADAPLDTGTVRPKAPKTWDSPPVTGLKEDGYTVSWQGRSADAVSVVAVCTTALPPKADPSAVAVSFEHHVAAGGYLFD
ncbi:hypothetical protein [Halopelagius longus]|uniref:Uncharacterized protein n=1 Tax=Halopelagius longus TaxID=1236180 RepID=A0A1H1EM48_9EURY|nr:hypothetical protein [Halopelagius longus]RDI71811.1 hypothetical protein DWB78_08785 [Halopelagius longus]SDQ89807.1 hypothetical protein SAMN05216278_2972 [Halopelagius longus]